MKKLKLTQRIYVGYTGLIGRYHFENGVSVEKIPHNERLRIAANFGVIEVEDDGSDGSNPSPAQSVVSLKRASIYREPLVRQTEDEKVEEDRKLIMGAEPLRALVSEEDLDEIAQKSGILGLRVVAGPWGVKSKSIPALILLILDAQKAYVEKQTAKLKDRGIPDAEIERLFAVASAPVTHEPKVVATPKAETSVAADEEKQATSVEQAAASGDLAAAISAGEGE